MGLKIYIGGQTNLIFVNDLGDVNFEGEITDYRTTPMAITGDDSLVLALLYLSLLQPSY